VKDKRPAIRRLARERGPMYKASERMARAAQEAVLEDAALATRAPRPAEVDLFGESTGFAASKRRGLSRVAKKNLAAAREELEREGPPLLLLYYAAREKLESSEKKERDRALELLIELLPYTAAKRVAVADMTPAGGGGDMAAMLRGYLAGMGGVGYVQGGEARVLEEDRSSSADLVGDA